MTMSCNSKVFNVKRWGMMIRGHAVMILHSEQDPNQQIYNKYLKSENTLTCMVHTLIDRELLIKSEVSFHFSNKMLNSF